MGISPLVNQGVPRSTYGNPLWKSQRPLGVPNRDLTTSPFQSQPQRASPGGESMETQLGRRESATRICILCIYI